MIAKVGKPHAIAERLVSTDEGKDSSNPAQSGIRNSNCFGSKGFNWRFKMRMKENNLGYTNL